ncbi:FecR domain-containing protein [Azotobacter vinelandii]|uniref:FecR domain-containing protein n=1 Tax=Azotobacter vinelandii TaxID=354 RepID=UPI000AF4E94E
MKPSSETGRPDHAALRQAADWYARLSADPHDAAIGAAWRRWHGQSEAHRQAWRYVERVGRRFAALQEDGDTAVRTLRAARRTELSRRQALGTLGVLSGGALLGWFGWRDTHLAGLVAAWCADYRTATGEVRDFLLADGTRIWLNAASALDSDYQPRLRRLHLLAGEVLIDTAFEDRPFVVDTAEGRLRALGTRFSVTQQDGHTRLAVFEGAVEVRTAGSGAARIVRAGEQLRFDRRAIGDPEPAAQARQAWSRGLLLVDDMSLAEFVEELSGHHRGYLGVAPEVAGLRVMGTYPLHDSERILGMLEGALPIVVQRPLPWWTSIEARR